jgi:GT2 family glycosyltransferase
VDHVMGCNMSYRREVLGRLGGFREDYPGISGVREDSDMCLRVRRLGYKVMFNPAAKADHIGAPQAKGRRFDARYVFYIERNHLTMLVRNFGWRSGILWRYLGQSAVNCTIETIRKVGGALARFGAVVLGTFVGLVSGTRLLIRTGRDPIRVDAAAQEIRQALHGEIVEQRKADESLVMAPAAKGAGL